MLFQHQELQHRVEPEPPDAVYARKLQADDPIVGSADPPQAIDAGAGARMVDSLGNPWSAGHVTASGSVEKAAGVVQDAMKKE